MSILKIIEYGNPILREKSKEVTKISKKIKNLIMDMLDTMYHANGVGLAAPQVGENLRIFVKFSTHTNRKLKGDFCICSHLLPLF